MKKLTCSKCRGLGKYHAMGFMFIDCKPCGGSGFVDMDASYIISEAVEALKPSELLDGDIAKKHYDAIVNDGKKEMEEPQLAEDKMDIKYDLFCSPSGGVLLFPKMEEEDSDELIALNKEVDCIEKSVEVKNEVARDWDDKTPYIFTKSKEEPKKRGRKKKEVV